MVDEVRELENNPSFYTNSGNNSPKKHGNFKKIGPAALVAIIGLIIILFIFLGGNYIPDAVNTVLTQETDMQCANGTIDKEWVFIETLKNGEVPKDTAEKLEKAGAKLVNNGTALEYKGKILSGDELFNELQSDVGLYTAFNDATYSCVAFYYDEAATKTFKELGTNRNNYTSSSDFNQVVGDAVGSGSDITINTVYKEEVEEESQKQKKNTEEEKPKFIYKKLTEEDTKTSSAEAEKIVNTVREQNPAETAEISALNTADILKVADTASKEQRSSSFFLYFMENISKMKAGEGNESKIHEAMNFLTDVRETQVVDTDTGEIVTSKGSPLESPSLYAILAKSEVKKEETKNYSSDRILKTVKNTTGAENSNNSILTTISSFGKNIKGAITRFIKNAIEVTEFSVLAPIIPTVSSTLINNSFENSIYGIAGGEFLVEGAVNTGKKLAIMGSGASAGDESAVLAYNKQVQHIANLNNQSDKLNRSPLDPTSKNTFLGSFIYKLLPIASKTGSITNVISKSLASILPGAHAKSNTSFLATFGDNETLSTISAAGTVHGSVIATFDTSTQHNPYSNEEFQAFIEENTEKDESGNTIIKDDSILAKYIIYNNERESPIGTNDAGILSSLQSSLKKILLSTNLISMVELFENASDEEKRIASGAAFVNSANNPDWEQYKYAQRYVSINRALSILKQYSTEETAYDNLKGFEGNINSVVAFTEKYYQEHPKDNSYEGYLARITGLPKENIIAALEESEYQDFIANYNPSGRYIFESLNTRDNNLVISKVSNQTFTPTLIKFGEYIVEKNDWVEA